MQNSHERYQSVFSWRYGSEAMRELWSEAEKRRRMRTVWLALAEAQAKAGLVTAEQVEALRKTRKDIDIERASEIEKTTRHDVMAEILLWAEQTEVGGPIIHLGATSADITDNVDVLRIRDGLVILRDALRELVSSLADRVDEFADLVSMGWTHLQPASPTTIGYRLASTLQDLLQDLRDLDRRIEELHSKGFKGAVGTAASYDAILQTSEMDHPKMEAMAMDRLGLKAELISTQVYPRKTDWRVINDLASIAASASLYAFNIRLMQSPVWGEWSEGFGKGQVGSSAMPWKRNPINAENVDSLARYVAGLPQVAWHNATQTLLDRTLDDSANRRVILPDAFMATEEILRRCLRLSSRLAIDERAVSRNLDRFGPFAASERVLVAAAAKGGDRQRLHEVIRTHSLEAWADVEDGRANSLANRLSQDEELLRLLDSKTISSLIGEPEGHVGNAPDRARAMARITREYLSDNR